MSEVVSDIYEKKVKCPNCSNAFKTMKVRSSRLRVSKRDADYFVMYSNEHMPLFFNPIKCPKCGFASLDEKFNKALLPVERKIINDKIKTLEYYVDYSGERNLDQSLELYKYCFIVAQKLDNSYLLLGKIAHRIAWHYRILEDDVNEREYLILARECYKSAYSKEDLNNCNMDELTLAFLIAELNRRTEEYKDAINWFSRIVSNRGVKSKPGLENQAREQLQLAKEAFDALK